MAVMENASKARVEAVLRAHQFDIWWPRDGYKSHCRCTCGKIVADLVRHQATMLRGVD